MKYLKKLLSQENILVVAMQSVQFSSKECKNKLIDGKKLADNFLDRLKDDISKWILCGNRAPHLSVVLVSDDQSNEAYVKMKRAKAKSVGMTINVHRLAKSTPQTDVLQVIKELNQDDSVDGILVQLPLSNHMDYRQVCNTIHPSKDIDGFTPNSLGKLCLNQPSFVPCTALAVHHIICSLGEDFTGKKAVICGRSKHVGLPIALILHSSTKLGEIEGLNMSTTICHRHTPIEDLAIYAREADVLITAVGKPNIIRGNMIKPGAIVIDVGFTEVFEEGQRRIAGDVNTSEAVEMAGMISPVPGGVGPMTVAMVINNTFLAAKYKTKN